MAAVNVYTPAGVEELKDPVDARECVEHCGYTYEPTVKDDKTETDKGAVKPDKKAAG